MYLLLGILNIFWLLVGVALSSVIFLSGKPEWNISVLLSMISVSFNVRTKRKLSVGKHAAYITALEFESLILKFWKKDCWCTGNWPSKRLIEYFFSFILYKLLPQNQKILCNISPHFFFYYILTDTSKGYLQQQPNKLIFKNENKLSNI